MGAGPRHRPFEKILHSPLDLASSHVRHLIPPQVMIVPEENLKDMAERQIDQPGRCKEHMKGRTESGVKLMFEIGKRDLLSHVLQKSRHARPEMDIDRIDSTQKREQ